MEEKKIRQHWDMFLQNTALPFFTGIVFNFIRDQLFLGNREGSAGAEGERVFSEREGEETTA